MNGPHDMGGEAGFGSVSYEANAPIFHADWERRVFALTLAMGPVGRWNIDQSRSARERTPGYLSKTYFELWLAGLEKLMAERGLASREEIEAGHAMGAIRSVDQILTADRVAPALARGGPTLRETIGAPAFAIGDRVRARDINPSGHTRLPRYVRGKTGVIVRDRGVFLFPDTNAHFLGEKPQHMYSVRFSGRELWGDRASPRDFVHLDMWDDYLERL